MIRPIHSFLWAACTALLLVWAAPETAAQTAKPPGKMAFQGFLTDSSGVARGQTAPQNFTVTFRLYKTTLGDASTAIWAESQVVTVDKGHFSVILGEGTSVPGTTGGADLSPFFIGTDASDRFLGVQVGGETEISPRIQFLPAPYSQLARYATELVGSSGASVLKVGAGTVGINLAGAAAYALEVNGTIKATNYLGDGSNLTNLAGANLKDLSVADSKLATISAAGKVANSATTATSTNTNNAIVSRDKNGDFAAAVITAKTVNASSIATDGIAVNGPVNLGDAGGRLRPGGIASEVNGTLVNFGVNDSRFGPGSNADQAGLFRVDTRSGQPVFAWHAKAANAAALSEVMEITSAGNVGIGTGGAAPTQAKLVVRGVGPGNRGVTGSLWDGVLVATQSGAVAYQGYDSVLGGFSSINSIYADNYVQASAFVAFSDERIKNVQGRSDGAADLATLLGIEITDFRYKDVVARGSASHKKVIAQQVERVFPQAVSKQTDVVPDIYKVASCKGGWIELATNLQKGERVRLIGKGDHEDIVEVLEIGKDRFRTSFDAGSEQVMVYGREVKDFRTVDYEAIAMLNVSATQQIKKEKDAEVKALQEENNALRARLENLEARDKTRTAALEQMNTLRTELAALQKLVARMAALRENGSSTTVAAR